MPIYGDHGFAYKSTAAANTGYEIVKKIQAVIEYVPTLPSGAPAGSVGHHWQLDPLQTSDLNGLNAASSTDFYLLLQPKPQTWTPGDEPADNNLEDPNDQQILLHGVSDRIFATYAPKGGIVLANYNFSFTPGISGPSSFEILTSGRRQLALNAASITAANTNGTFWMAEYRDQNVVTKFPSTSLFIAFEGGTSYFNEFRYGLHVGSIVSPYNLNDPKIAPAGPSITGDAVFAGILASGLATVTTANLYFLGNWTTSVGPCVRVGDNWYDIVTENSVIAGDPLLNDINGKERFVPYEIFAEQLGTTQRPLIGYTKYIRQFKTSITINPTVLKNNIAGSAQAWLGWVPTVGTAPNDHNQIALWNKYPVIVV